MSEWSTQCTGTGCSLAGCHISLWARNRNVMHMVQGRFPSTSPCSLGRPIGWVGTCLRCICTRASGRVCSPLAQRNQYINPFSVFFREIYIGKKSQKRSRTWVCVSFYMRRSSVNGWFSDAVFQWWYYCLKGLFISWSCAFCQMTVISDQSDIYD